MQVNGKSYLKGYIKGYIHAYINMFCSNQLMNVRITEEFINKFDKIELGSKLLIWMPDEYQGQLGGKSPHRFTVQLASHVKTLTIPLHDKDIVIVSDQDPNIFLVLEDMLVNDYSWDYADALPY